MMIYESLNSGLSLEIQFAQEQGGEVCRFEISGYFLPQGKEEPEKEVLLSGTFNDSKHRTLTANKSPEHLLVEFAASFMDNIFNNLDEAKKLQFVREVKKSSVKMEAIVQYSTMFLLVHCREIDIGGNLRSADSILVRRLPNNMGEKITVSTHGSWLLVI